MLKLSGSLEHRLVEVGRLEQQDHLLALFERRAVEFDVGGDRARHVLHRRGPAQHLFDRVGQQRPSRLTETLALIGVAQQLPVPPDSVWRVVSSPPINSSSTSVTISWSSSVRPIDLRVHQDAHQVVGRLLLASCDHAHHVLGVGGEGVHARPGNPPRPQCCSSKVTMSSDHLRNISRSSGSTPSMSPMTAIGSGAARSQTKSHSPRSHTASISASHREPIDPLEILHPLSREASVDELAPQQMCRDRPSSIIIGGGVLVGPDAARIGEQLRLPLGLDHRLVRRRGGQAVAVPEDRLVLAHPLVDRPRVAGVERAVGQIHIRLGRGHGRTSCASPNDISTLAAELETSARFGRPSEASSLASGCSPSRTRAPPIR